MPKMRFYADIRRPPETVYKTLTDLAGYNSWLRGSQLYMGTTVTSDTPVQVGTTYIDQGRLSTMPGKVTELVPNEVVAFQQATYDLESKKRRGMDTTIRYVLEPTDEGTYVRRTVHFRVHGMLFLVLPFLMESVRRENNRIMDSLQLYLEARV